MDPESLLVELESTNVEQQVKALEKLRKVAKVSDEKRTEIADVGLTKLGRLLRTTEDERLKERVVILLVYLGKTESNRDLIRECGLLNLLLGELGSQNKVVLHNAMAALVNCSIGNTLNQNLARETGSLSTIVELMNDPHPKTKQNACWLLKKLVTNNAKNSDALRELGALSTIVPLLGSSEQVDVQEHAIALLAFLLDKHTRNRSTFRDVKGGPAAVVAMYERVQGSGTKTEEYCSACVESLGGMKKLLKDGEATSVTTVNSGRSIESHDERFGGGEPIKVPTVNTPAGGGGEAKSPKSPRNFVKSPRPEKTKPSDSKPAVSPRAGSSKTPRGFFGFGKKKEDAGTDSSSKWAQNLAGKEEDPVYDSGGGKRRSIGDDE